MFGLLNEVSLRGKALYVGSASEPHLDYALSLTRDSHLFNGRNRAEKKER